MNEWPEKSMVDDRLLPYYCLRSELVIDDDLFFKGHQLVIPSSARDEMLECSHKAHVRNEICLRRMRETIYWPGMAADIEKLSAAVMCVRSRTTNSRRNQLYSIMLVITHQAKLGWICVIFKVVLYWSVSITTLDTLTLWRKVNLRKAHTSCL